MGEYRNIRVYVKELNDSDLRPNDYVNWQGDTYKFLGWEYGTYPIVEDLDTGETKSLPHF